MKEKESRQGNSTDNRKKIIIASLLVLVVLVVLLLIFLNRNVKYDITFETNGGTLIETISVDENGTIIRPADPVRENYEFAGWYYNDEPFDFSTPVTSDMVLEARWVAKGKVSGIKLDKSSLTLYIGETAKLTATITPENATDKNVTWESSNSKVVSVDANGNIKALAEGTATITVTTVDGGFTAKAQITVKKEETKEPTNKPTNNETPNNGSNNNEQKPTVTVVNVTGVTLDKTTLTLTEGGSSKLTATVNPSNASNKNVTWVSSNTAVATVDSNGNVTAVKAGTATITVTTVDGGYTATCTVTVNEKPASYSVIFTPIIQEGTGAIVQYTVAVTKNNSSFDGFNFISYNGTVVKKTLSSKAYNNGITSATIRLNDGTDVSATVIYK